MDVSAAPVIQYGKLCMNISASNSSGQVISAGLEIKKKFQVAIWGLSKKKRSPNAKLKSPDNTGTETQIRASFN